MFLGVHRDRSLQTHTPPDLPARGTPAYEVDSSNIHSYMKSLCRRVLICNRQELAEPCRGALWGLNLQTIRRQDT